VSKHNIFYFAREGTVNMFSHGFMSFAAVGITVACLLIMGTFTLVAVNANAMLEDMESQNQMLAFVDKSLSEEEARALQRELLAVENVSAVEFISNVEAAEAFRAWCAGETAFAGWGTGDVETLNENCKYWGLAPFQAETVYDFQRAFSHAVGADRQIALWRAVEQCQIPDLFPFHDALYDSLYTSVIGCWLTP